MPVGWQKKTYCTVLNYLPWNKTRNQSTCTVCWCNNIMVAPLGALVCIWPSTLSLHFFGRIIKYDFLHEGCPIKISQIANSWYSCTVVITSQSYIKKVKSCTLYSSYSIKDSKILWCKHYTHNSSTCIQYVIYIQCALYASHTVLDMYIYSTYICMMQYMIHLHTYFIPMVFVLEDTSDSGKDKSVQWPQILNDHGCDWVVVFSVFI